MVPKTSLALVLALSTTSTTARSIDKRIIGGEEAAEGEFPSMVSFQSNGHECGGVLLDSTTVLTADHCGKHDTSHDKDRVVRVGTTVSARPPDPSQALLRLAIEAASGRGAEGRNAPTGGKRDDNIGRSRIPAEWCPAEQPTYWPNDIQIWKLLTAIEESDKIKYAKLPEEGSDPAPNSTAITVGWGDQGAESFHVPSPVSKLHKVTLPVHDRQVCIQADPNAGGRDSIVCAGGGGRGVGNFDSGGPLFDAATGTLIGITSWVPKEKNGAECGQMPTVFTRIKANLGGGVGQPPSAEELWIREATLLMSEHCSRFLHEDPDDACGEASGECLKEMPQDTPDTELLRCLDFKEACAGQKGEPAKHSQCIEKAKVCVKEKDIRVGGTEEIQECALKDL
ncbi:Trypsin [Beauveria bassiana]|nr:Trypsin [Beauveria bassiana]KAH8721297.1 Trypsin [Beauveria bassiana]